MSFLVLPHSDKTVRVGLLWRDALKETLYPLHQSEFKLQKKHRAADPEPTPYDFATAQKKCPTALRSYTEARIKEFLTAHFAPIALVEIAEATRTQVLVTNAHLNRTKTKIASMDVDIVYRPPAAEQDHRISMVMKGKPSAAKTLKL